MNFVPGIRLTEPRDHVHLRSLDVHCFDNCWTEDDWQGLDPSLSSVLVACFYSTPIAMLVCVLRDYKGQKVLCVRKLCVRAQYRRHGLSRKLLARAYDMQKSVGANALALAVPEHLADPTNPLNCLEWAEKMGFRAQGILPEKIIAYGQAEDVFLFTFEREP